jgi:hypothetical protein
MKVSGSYFCGNRISEYGIKKGFVDYSTLAKAFDHVLMNDAITWFDDFEPICGNEDDEVMQWYLVSEAGAELLKECGEAVWYSPSHDVYLWAVTHWGTSWDYVLTAVQCGTGGAEN